VSAGFQQKTFSFGALAPTRCHLREPGQRTDRRFGGPPSQVEIQAKYEGYIERQREEVERRSKLETLAWPTDIDYRAVRGLSGRSAAKAQPVSAANNRSGIAHFRGHAGRDLVAMVHLKRGFQPHKKTA